MSKDNKTRADLDLDILLAEYRNQRADDFQIQKWKAAVRAEQEALSAVRRPNRPIWHQLIAATLIGFIVGALVYRSPDASHVADKDYFSDDATIEYVVTKLD